jgi:Bacterial regulatory proteins, tetR family
LIRVVDWSINFSLRRQHMAEQATAEACPSAKSTTKEALVDAGLRIMLEKGYRHTGIQDVLQAAGVSKGSFYPISRAKRRLGSR